MSKFYVGDNRVSAYVLVHRPRRALTHLTPSNCHDLLFDDVLAVERAGKEHDAFTQTLRDRVLKFFFLLTCLNTLAVPEAKDVLSCQKYLITVWVKHSPAVFWATYRSNNKNPNRRFILR